MKPRNVKQAIEDGRYNLYNIYSKHDKKIRVDFRPRHANNGLKFVSFWIDRDYFKRTYPNLYSNN